jgi:hypothetical protein
MLNFVNQTTTEKQVSNARIADFVVHPITASQGIEHAEFMDENVSIEADEDADSASDYLSFESGDEVDDTRANAEREVRERERRMVLEAAGLIVHQDTRPPPITPITPRSKSTIEGDRLAPAIPRRRTVRLSDPYIKDLPPLPDAEPMDHTTRLDDAYERFASFRNQQLSSNRLSLISIDSASLSSPTVSVSTKEGALNAPREENQGRYSQFLQLFSGFMAPENEKKSISTLVISGPIAGVPSDTTLSASTGFGSVSVD